MDQDWGKTEGPTGGGCAMAFVETFLFVVVLVVLGVIAVYLWGSTFS